MLQEIRQRERETHSFQTQFRTVDFDVNPPPMHAHFVRIDDGNWYQHVNFHWNHQQHWHNHLHYHHLALLEYKDHHTVGGHYYSQVCLSFSLFELC